MIKFSTLFCFEGYASDFKESSFDQVAGIKELEEDFFPHEDLVRWDLSDVNVKSVKNPGWRRKKLQEFVDFKVVGACLWWQVFNVLLILSMFIVDQYLEV